MRRHGGLARVFGSIVAVVTIGTTAVVDPALAHQGAGGEQLPKDAPAVAPDGEKAKKEIAAVEADPRAAKLGRRALEKARRALGRAHGAHLAGDGDGARLLSRVALAWSGAARAVLRAAD